MTERITITIDTGNAAFDDAPAREIANILRDLAQRIQIDGLPPSFLRDTNGNTCGFVSVTEMEA